MIEHMVATTAEEKNKYLVKEEIVDLTLPQNWWNSNNSFEYFGNKNIHDFTLFRFKSKSIKNLPEKKVYEKYEIPTFDASKGDYRIKNVEYIKKDYAFYRKKKENIVKYAIYPYTFIGIVFIYTILSFLTKF